MCRGMFPANQLARKHPFILNARIEPLQWAKMAVRGRLPAYEWKDVLNDIKKHAGTHDACHSKPSRLHDHTGFALQESRLTSCRAVAYDASDPQGQSWLSGQLV